MIVQTRKEKIKEQFLQTVTVVREQYMHRIQQLEEDIKTEERRRKGLEKEIKRKDYELEQVKQQNDQLKAEIQRLETVMVTLTNDKESALKESRYQLIQKQTMVTKLSQDIKQMQEQMRFFKTQEDMSVDQSTISMQQYSRQSFSFEISEIFRNAPEQILKFLQSIEGQKPSDPIELGDMTCMFVGRDGLSLQKYLNVNRNFLKRKIKQHEKKNRFRFVLIYKPDH